MDAAFLSLFIAPAARSWVFAIMDLACAGGAANRRIPLRHKRVARKGMFLEILRDLV
jgi:hypothetical protein